MARANCIFTDELCGISDKDLEILRRIEEEHGEVLDDDADGDMILSIANALGEPFEDVYERFERIKECRI